MKRPIEHTPARAPEAIQFARDQRTAANEFAQAVWQWIRNRQICGQKFLREFPIPPYTADFCCVELKLILEIDGAHHVTAEGQARDRVRDEALARQGFLVVRNPGLRSLARTRAGMNGNLTQCSPSPPAPLP